MKLGKIMQDLEASQIYRKLYDTMVSEEKFCVIKPYSYLVENKGRQPSKEDQQVANSLTIYLFPIRNGSTEFNRDLNRQLGGLCEQYWDVNSSNLCQIGFFATIKRKVVLKRNFLNPKILELQKSSLDDSKKDTPTKKGQVKSILKSKRRETH